jgi:hypothetical protein
MKKEERNILHTIKCRKVDCIGHILHQNCLLKCIIGGQMKELERQGRRHKQLMDYLKEYRRY